MIRHHGPPVDRRTTTPADAAGFERAVGHERAAYDDRPDRADCIDMATSPESAAYARAVVAALPHDPFDARVGVS